jgi:hypothetical protein
MDGDSGGHRHPINSQCYRIWLVPAGSAAAVRRMPAQLYSLPRQPVAVVLQAQRGVVSSRQRQQRPVLAPALCGRRRRGEGPAPSGG